MGGSMSDFTVSDEIKGTAERVLNHFLVLLPDDLVAELNGASTNETFVAQ